MILGAPADGRHQRRATPLRSAFATATIKFPGDGRQRHVGVIEPKGAAEAMASPRFSGRFFQKFAFRKSGLHHPDMAASTSYLVHRTDLRQDRYALWGGLSAVRGRREDEAKGCASCPPLKAERDGRTRPPREAPRMPGKYGRHFTGMTASLV